MHAALDYLIIFWRQFDLLRGYPSNRWGVTIVLKNWSVKTEADFVQFIAQETHLRMGNGVEKCGKCMGMFLCGLSLVITTFESRKFNLKITLIVTVPVDSLPPAPQLHNYGNGYPCSMPRTHITTLSMGTSLIFTPLFP